MSNTQADAEYRQLLKRALARIEALESSLAEAGRPAREPVAIVGMGCRFPGGADSPEAFWKLLRAGRDAVGETPSDRWDADAYYDPDPDAPGRMYTRRGGFLERVDEFDPQFFGISPREAVAMDPQQRLLLEVVWETLEDAAIAPRRLAGSRTGVFIGMTGQDYSFLQMENDPTGAAADAYSATGTSHSIAAGRLSYVLGLEGPCVTLDTACSSSIVAVHLAMQSLRAGESDLCLAGSSHLMLSPAGTIATCKARMLSPDGRCKTFDVSADGYVRGEGCAVVALKLLSRALADGDPIHAVIRGSAVNQDGRSNGLTAPNGRAQENVIQAALADAGVEARDIQYVEAHGTGTSLGDPIELRALVQTLGIARSPEAPLWVGSVKTNIGHLEPAAGIAGLIKVALALRAREIPPHLHLREPNPCIDWATSGLRVPSEPIPWPVGKRLLAGLSSFGFSGTNSHLIMEAAPTRPKAEPGRVGRDCELFTLSARNEEGLEALARRYADYLDAHPETELSEICAAVNGGRNDFGRRMAAVVSSIGDLRGLLRSEQREGAAVMRGEAHGTLGNAIGFLFMDDGAAELIGAARELHAGLPSFRTELERCHALSVEHLGSPLLEGLLAAPDAPEARRMEQPQFARAAQVALQWALAAQWRAWGIAPSACLGQGAGELAAAAVAGALTLEEAMRLACADGGDALAKAAAELTPRPLATGLVQGLSGELWQGGQGPAGEYWLEQGRRPAAPLAAGLAALRAAGCRAFFQIGSGEALGGDAPGESDGTLFLSAIPAGRGAWAGLMETAGRLWTAGAPLRTEALAAPGTRRLAGLPTYPFQRKRYWFAEQARSATAPLPQSDPSAHPLLGRRIPSPLRQAQFTAMFNPRTLDVMRDHRFFGVPVLPAATYLEMAVTAASEMMGPGACRLDEIRFYEPLILTENESAPVHLTLEPTGPGQAAFNIHRSNGEQGNANWQPLASGRVTLLPTGAVTGTERLADARARCLAETNVNDFYQSLLERGASYGTAMRNIRRLWVGQDEALGQIELDRAASANPHYSIHPGLLDACLQLAGAATLSKGEASSAIYMLWSLAHARVWRKAGASLWGHARLRDYVAHGVHRFSADFQLWDEQGSMVAELHDLTFQKVSRQQQAASQSGAPNSPYYGIRWTPTHEPERDEGKPAGRWVILEDRSGVGRELAGQLQRRGGEPRLIQAGESDLAGTLRDLGQAAPEGAPLQGVIDLRGLDAAAEDGEATPGAALRSSLELIGALKETNAARLTSGRLRLCVITRGAQDCGGAGPSRAGLVQAPLLGLTRVATLEHPELMVTRLDLDPASKTAADESALLAREILAGSDEDTVAWRNGGRFAARLEQLAAPGSGEEPESGRGLMTEGTILITGGLGGLGLETARWLVERGAWNLALIGRRPPSPEAREALREMESQGARVLALPADVSQREDMKRVLALIEATMPPVRGVIHAAGVIDGRLLIEQDAEHAARVLAPKVAGAWNLHELTREQPLDFCIYFSSIASIFGGVGQGAYAAANAFLDALAAYRRGLGLPALAVNLGPFSETGMTARMDAKLLETALTGVELMTPRQGLEALPALLKLGRSQAALARIDWKGWGQAYGALAKWPFFSDLIPASGAEAEAAPAKRRMREELLAAAPKERPAILSEYLNRRLGELLGFSEEIDPQRSILDLGFDSLVAVQFKNHLDSELGAGITIGQMLEGPSVEELTKMILAGWRAAGEDAPRPAAEAAGGRAGSGTDGNAEHWEEGEL